MQAKRHRKSEREELYTYFKNLEFCRQKVNFTKDVMKNRFSSQFRDLFEHMCAPAVIALFEKELAKLKKKKPVKIGQLVHEQFFTELRNFNEGVKELRQSSTVQAKTWKKSTEIGGIILGSLKEFVQGNEVLKNLLEILKELMDIRAV